MPRKEREVVPEGNGPVHQREKIGSGQPTLEDVCHRLNEALDRWDKMLNETSEKMHSYFDRVEDVMRERDQHLFDTPGAWSSAAASCRGGRRARKHEDSRAYGGRRNSSTSNAWGLLFCMPG